MTAGCRLTAMVSLCCLCFAHRLAAQEWTRFRGPNGSGVSKASTIPVHWTQEDENWRVRLPGVGHSCPVLWGKRLFVSSADEDSGTRHVYCIDAASGRKIWSHEYATSRHAKHQLNSFATSTPAVDEQRLYLCWATDKSLVATAIDHQGKQVWQTDLGSFKAGHGYGISPIVHREQVIIANDQQGESSLIAVDRRTGNVRWRVPRQTKVTYSTPCVYKRNGRPAELIFTNWRHGITAVNPANGKTKWEITVFDQKHVETAIGSPIVVGDMVLGTCGWLGYATHTVAVRSGESDDDPPTQVYRMDRGAPLTTTPVVGNGLLFLWADNGIVTCADASNGDVFWTKRVGGKYFGSPVIAGSHVYCMSADGEVVVIAASKDYKLVARNSLGEGSHSSPAVANGTMYLRTFSQVISIGGKK